MPRKNSSYSELEGGPDDNGSAAELHDKNRKKVKNIYNQARAMVDEPEVENNIDSTQCGGDFRACIYLEALIRLVDAGRTPHDRTIGLVMVSIACVGAMQRLVIPTLFCV